MRHAWRPHPFAGETTVELTDAGLQVSPPAAAPRLAPYAAVTRVNLRRRPLRAATDDYICRIEAHGMPATDVRSVAWRHPFWPQDRSATYLPFVHELHRRLSWCQPPPLFIAGDPPRYFALLVALWLLPVPAIFVALTLGGADWPTRIFFTVGSVFPFGFVALVWWYRRLRPNRPRSYDPLAIPSELLPPMKNPPR
jgi:hypothetical protein